ncbi:MAG: hypothetical protein ACFFKA_00680 [Candidatus Thorarchaeota archaeon]
MNGYTIKGEDNSLPFISFKIQVLEQELYNFYNNKGIDCKQLITSYMKEHNCSEEDAIIMLNLCLNYTYLMRM